MPGGIFDLAVATLDGEVASIAQARRALVNDGIGRQDSVQLRRPEKPSKRREYPPALK
jgi:hypothetical protein